MLKHKHLIVRAEIGLPLNKSDCDFMSTKLYELIKILDMKVMHGPIVKYCEKVGNIGMTGFAVIETSHVAFHHWNECDPAIMEFDVYSCSDFSPFTIFNWMNFLLPQKISYKFLDREEDIKELSQGNITQWQRNQ